MRPGPGRQPLTGSNEAQRLCAGQPNLPTCTPSPPRRRRTRCGGRAPDYAPRTARRAGCASSPRSSAKHVVGVKRAREQAGCEEPGALVTHARVVQVSPERATRRRTVRKGRGKQLAGPGTALSQAIWQAVQPSPLSPHPPCPRPLSPSCCRRAQRWSPPASWVCPQSAACGRAWCQS